MSRKRITKTNFKQYKELLESVKGKRGISGSLVEGLQISKTTAGRIRKSETYEEYKQLLKEHNDKYNRKEPVEQQRVVEAPYSADEVIESIRDLCNAYLSYADYRNKENL